MLTYKTYIYRSEPLLKNMPLEEYLVTLLEAIMTCNTKQERRDFMMERMMDAGEWMEAERLEAIDRISKQDQ